jgi:hypothetical protein
VTKGQLWDQLKAELWIEIQGTGWHREQRLSSEFGPGQARALYDRMLTMETLAHPVEMGKGAEALVAGYGRG